MRFFKSTITFSLIAFACSVSNADVILGVSSASTPLGSFNSTFDIGNMIDQSGLSATYASGVTDFGAFTASTTHSVSSQNIRWLSPLNASLPAPVTLGFGSSKSISRMALWNYPLAGGANMFNVFADSDSNFANGTSGSLGSFSLSNAPNSDVSAQIFDIADTTTPFVHLQIINSHGSTAVGLSEVVFESTAAVPEPTSLLLFGSGIAGLAFRRRRKH